jgi:competence protein ComEC
VTAAAGDGVPRHRRLDLRLVPAAAAAWLVTVLAQAMAPGVLVTCALTAGGLAAAVYRRRTSAAAVLAGLLVAVASTAACAAVRAWEHTGSPLVELARSGSTATLVLRIDGVPRPLPAPGSRVVLDATVRGLERAGARATLHDAVVLFAPSDGWRGLVPGQTVRAAGKLSPASPGDVVAALVSVRGPPIPLRGPGWAQRAAAGLRDGLVHTAARTLPPEEAGLLPGLVVGDTRALDPVLEGDFRTAGLTHLVAVSGANVAIVLAGVLWPLRLRAVDRRIQAVVGVLALAGFVLLAQSGASVLRAAVMGGVALIALAGGRARSAVPALCAAVIVLLLVEPPLAADAGFALSVTATAAIVVVAPGWAWRLRARRVPRLLADAVAVSAAAGVATAPIIAALSGQVSLVSLPANLLAAPAVAPATVLGLLAAVLGPLLPAAADAAAWLAGWPVRWLAAVAHGAAELPDSAAAWPAGAGGAALLTVLLLAGVGLLWRFPRARPPALAALVGLIVVGWPLRQTLRGWPPAATDLVACDVGQGDALVVPTAPGQAVLVDVGPDPGLEDRCLRRLGITDIPLLMLSHLDADHVTGLAGALHGRRVGVIATGTLPPTDHRIARVDALARAAGVQRATLVPGNRRILGSATVEVLAPPPQIATPQSQPNDLCLLVRVTQRGVRILLTGDLNAEAEARIVARGVDLRADVLKVPHHGSSDADPAFLAATGARVALVSVGADNPYGHPAARTMRWLAADGMRVHRTDREGDLAVVGAGSDWGVAHRGSTTVLAAPAGTAGVPGSPERQGVTAARASVRQRRWAVAACRRGRRTPSPDLPAARRRRRGGVAPGPRRGGRAEGRARPPQ